MEKKTKGEAMPKNEFKTKAIVLDSGLKAPKSEPETQSEPANDLPMDHNQPLTAELNQPLTAEQLKEQLDKQLKLVARRQKLAFNRETFISKKKELEEALNELETEKADGNFTSSQFKLSLAQRVYNKESILFNLAFPELIVKLILMLMAEIDGKVAELEREILL